jgi:hypothetical protein
MSVTSRIQKVSDVFTVYLDIFHLVARTFVHGVG